MCEKIISKISWQNHPCLEGLVSHKTLPYNNIDNNMLVHTSLFFLDIIYTELQILHMEESISSFLRSW